MPTFLPYPKPVHTGRNLNLFLIVWVSLGLSGCALFGTVKGVDEKASDQGLKVQVLNLEKDNPQAWKKLNAAGATDPESAGETPDVAFQSVKTSSTISLNSVCRQKSDNGEYPADDLEQVTETLFMGFQGLANKEQSVRQLTAMPEVKALQTTAQGRIQKRDIKLSAVVFQKKNCTYDVVYLAPVKKFPEHQADFDRFLSELRIP